MDEYESTQNDNEQTLRAYQNKTQEYVTGTPAIDDTIRKWLDASLALIPESGTILEVGSGFGRDAEYIRGKGYAIECSDAVPKFIEILESKGFSARLINLLSDDIGGEYDMVVADAVLLHFTPEETKQVIDKIYHALKAGGVFALRMKQGDGAVWTDAKLGEPRYFYYWQEDELRQVLEGSGFTWQGMTTSHTEHNNADWMHIIVRKTERDYSNN